MQFVQNDRFPDCLQLSNRRLVATQFQTPKARARLDNRILLSKAVFIGKKNENPVCPNSSGYGVGKSFEQVPQSGNRA